MLLAQPFGFGESGHITITLKKLALYRRHDQADKDFSLKNLGIVMTDVDTQAKLEEYLQASKCPLQDSDMVISTFDNPLIQKVLTGEKDAAELAVEVKNTGLTSLFFINCEDGMPASFAVKVEQYNLVGPDGRKDYLAVGETELDVMYWVRAKCYQQYSKVNCTCVCWGVGSNGVDGLQLSPHLLFWL